MSSTTVKRRHRTQSPNHPVAQALIITIDGPAGVGKSTAARLLARRLGLTYLDTGATYRALAYEALARSIALSDVPRLSRLARSLELVFKPSSHRSVSVLLQGCDVTRQIRTERVTDAAAVIAQYPRVRAELVRLQRCLARAQSIVAEGRDTGSVVFPHAAYKFFLTANARVRAQRRQRELRTLQGRSPSVPVIAQQLRERDRLDRRRVVGPLIRPRQAILVDTSCLDAAAVVQRMLRYLPAPPLLRFAPRNRGAISGTQSRTPLLAFARKQGGHGAKQSVRGQAGLPVACRGPAPDGHHPACPSC